MGLLKKLATGFLGKKITRGIGKVFKKVFKGVGKFLNSKLGKGIMLGLAVFTMGTALMAGAQAWGAAGKAGASFFGKFVAGGKAVIGSMMGAQQAGAATPTPAGQLAASGAEQAGAVADLAGKAGTVAGGTPSVAGELGQFAQGMGGAAQTPSASLLTSGGAPSLYSGAGIAAPQQAGMLSKLAKGAGTFLKSEGGGQLVGSMVKGYAEGAAAEEIYKRDIKEKRRFEKLWEDTDLGERAIFDIQTPVSNAARNVAGATPRVSYGG